MMATRRILIPISGPTITGNFKRQLQPLSAIYQKLLMALLTIILLLNFRKMPGYFPLLKITGSRMNW